MYKKIGLIGLILTMFLVSCANKTGTGAQNRDVQKQTENIQQQVGQTQQQTVPAGQVVPQQAIPQQAVPMQQEIPQQAIPQQAIPWQSVPVQQTFPQLNNQLEGGIGAVNQSVVITLDQAKQIAVADANVDTTSAVFTKMSSDYDDGLMKWEIDFVAGNTKYEYEINSIDGTILKKEIEVVTQAGFPQEANPFQQSLAVDPTGQPGAGVDIERAKQIAVQHAGVDMASVIFIKLERDVERATPRWEIEFVIGNMQYEYEINAVNGAILKFKTKKFTMN
jgi:uncharacterized membrane protein YkoI